MRRIRTGIAATAATLALLPAVSAAAECPGQDVEALALGQAAAEQSLHCLINERRAEAGLAFVRPSDQLRQAGLGHSQDMVSRSFFSHTSPSGTDFIDRILRTGYARKARSWTVGENLVWGSGELSTPAAMVDAWMNSPSHRENVLRPRFQEMGIALVAGTPEDASDPAGVTVSSEYGYRTFARKGKGKSASARKAQRKRKLKRRRARARAARRAA